MSKEKKQKAQKPVSEKAVKRAEKKAQKQEAFYAKVKRETVNHCVCTDFINEGIANTNIFPDKKAKKAYLRFLRNGQKTTTARVIAFSIIGKCAYVLIKAQNYESANLLNTYVNVAYSKFFNEEYAKVGFVFRDPVRFEIIDRKHLTQCVSFVHQTALREVSDIVHYRYCSYMELLNGGKVASREALLDALEIEDFSADDYNNWHNIGGRKRFKLAKGKEKPNAVLTSSLVRYGNEAKNIPEGTLKFVVIDLNLRTGLSYYKIMKKLALDPIERRDILIEVIAEMATRMGASYTQAVSALGIPRDEHSNLLIETIVYLNKRYNYSYDYIIARLQVPDSQYDLLGIIMLSMNDAYGCGFVEMAQKFAINNNLIPLRRRINL